MRMLFSLLLICGSDTLSVPKYLDWLVKQVEQLGGSVQREQPVTSLQEVIDKYKCDVLINCTGNGAAHLTDVRDTNMYTIRGQTILVRAPHIKKQMYRDGMGFFFPTRRGKTKKTH